MLRRIEDGEDLVITMSEWPVDRLDPAQHAPREWLSRAELIRRLAELRADPDLRDDLARLAGATTDDLGPVR